MATRPHVVVVPYPNAGNINPALQLAKLLHRHGVYITFVNTEHNHRRVQAAMGAGAAVLSSGEGFRFEAIPDGLSESDDRGAPDAGRRLCKSVTSPCAAASLRDLVERLGREPGVPPVTCLLPTAPMSLFALGVARELGVPAMVFWCASAASLRATMSIRELEERGYVPLKDESMLTNGYLETTIIDWIPGMLPMSLGDLMTFIRTTDPNDFWLSFSKSMVDNCTNADALILNTFHNLEADVLAAVRGDCRCVVYSIGPLGSLLRHGGAAAADDSVRVSLWKQDAACIAWLDTQEEQRSVVYVNFGSNTVLTPEQGLAASGHPFLWSIRENLAPGGVWALPPAFAAETAGRGHVTTWCPQEQVLRHPAVGCFLTHNGWNSTCEGVAAGVPMVCWPGCMDQFANCKYACDVWAVGVRLDAEERRDQVAERVREGAGRWREAAAAGHGGSSYQNLLAMVTALHHVGREPSIDCSNQDLIQEIRRKRYTKGASERTCRTGGRQHKRLGTVMDRGGLAVVREEPGWYLV
ncbi:hypothetical protein EJB05_50676, partial [Eragrostis curvula]